MKDAIIVADDSKIVKNIITKALEDKYVVLTADNGYDVVSLLVSNEEYNFVGLLLDLCMPKYDGFTVLDYFKKNNLFKKIPVAIISGDDTKETIDKAFKYEIIDMLNKPFSKENIQNIVNKMINVK